MRKMPKNVVISRFGGGGVIAAFLALVTACGDDAPAMTPDAGVVDAGRDAALSMDRCDSNRDCGGGEVCRDSFCRTTCASDGDCTAPLGVCDATLDYCVQCSADADCGRNEQCTANACAFYCREDAACDADEFCRMDTGACAARECETTSDCSGGFECVRFECVSIDPIVCDAGEEACSADNRTVLRCNADGTMEAMESCATDSRCVVSGTSASCAAVVCTAGEMGCTGDFVAFSCDATGTMRTETPCGAGRYCAAGTCMAQACVGEWDDETTVGHDETLEKSMLNGRALDNSMSLSRTLPMTRERQERQAKVASLISAFQQQPSAHLEDSTRDMRSQSAHSISRLEISSTYINSLLGLSAKEP